MSKFTIDIKNKTFTLPTGDTFKLSDMGLKRKPKESDDALVARMQEEIPFSLDNLELPVKKGKVTTIIKCQEPSCPLYRKVYTSDVHQVKLCRTHQKKARSKQTALYRKNAAAKKSKVDKKKPVTKKSTPKKQTAKKSTKK